MVRMKACVKKALVALLLLLIGALAAWSLRPASGVTREEVAHAVVTGTMQTTAHVDARCERLEKKLEQMDEKLDRILGLLVPALPDNMRAGE